MKAGGSLLVMDTATTRAVVALGTPAGELISQRSWDAGYRHGEELLARVEDLLHGTGTAPGDLRGLIIGTGPGAFTGLRVGLATAKGLAYALDLPIVGVATSEAILVAARQAGAPGASALALLQPAGPSDRVLSRHDVPSRILPGGTEPDLGPGEHLVAVDLDGRAPVEAIALGEAARAGLAGALLSMGAARLATGDHDDLATLVPEYVTLPRGVAAVPAEGAIAVSGGTGTTGSLGRHP